MEKHFTIVFSGYEVQAGGKPMPDGTYVPTLAIFFGAGQSRTRLDLPVPGAGSYVTITEAQEHALRRGRPLDQVEELIGPRRASPGQSAYLGATWR